MSELPDPVRYGDEGPWVRRAQILLNDHGADPRVRLDGVFGPLTQTAVWVFKGLNNLAGGGTVDAATWAMLLRPPALERSVPVEAPGSQALVVAGRLRVEDLMRAWYKAGMTQAQCGVLLHDFLLHSEPWSELGRRGVLALALEMLR